ncbi:MAG: tetratricopeptide repeat protein [Planctomycetota bacterium]
MNDPIRKLTIVAAVLAVSVVSATGQSRRRQITDPRDATRLDQPTRRRRLQQQQSINSQLFVTGQVSGLAAFRGDVPYGAPDSLRISVPSGEFGSFRRQSVGLPDLRDGGVFGTNVYRDPATTVTTAGRVLEDARLRGRRDSDQQDRRISGSLADELYVDATAGYRPIAPVGQESSSRGGMDLRVLPEQYSPRREDRGVRTSALGSDAGGMFGLIRSEQRSELVRQLRMTDEQRSRLPVGSRVESRADMVDESPLRTPEPRDADQLEDGAAVRETRAFVLPPEGEDVYVDLLVAMRDRRWQGESESRYDSAREAETLVRGGRRGRGDDATVRARPGGAVVVSGLAGKGGDLFNRHMEQGEQALKEGRYYDARRSYEMARLVDDKNPLASMGLAVSALAAGEPATAGFHLHRAMQLFPPIMETRFELTEMAPEQRLREMLDVLDKRLGDREDAQMLMLATFVHLNLGERQQARKYAERLAEAAETDAISSSYAEYVLTGKRPGDNAQTP